MPRYKCIVEYDGRPFCGWQLQADVPSVQQVFEAALARLAHQPVRVYCSGRTDAGVHALGQVVHFDLPKIYRQDAVGNALNHYLKPHPVAVIDCVRVDDDFHARFDSKRRRYRYRIINRRAPLALDQGRAWGVYAPLDVRAMADAAQRLVGHHDFTTFRATECQAKSAVKTLERLEVTACGDDEIRIFAESRSFLHHQVRNMTGTLVLVGKGRWRPEDVTRALEARDRRAGGPTAPPDGLYFLGVDY